MLGGTACHGVGLFSVYVAVKLAPMCVRKQGAFFVVELHITAGSLHSSAHTPRSGAFPKPQTLVVVPFTGGSYLT